AEDHQHNPPTMIDTGDLSTARGLHQSRRIVFAPSSQEAAVGTKDDARDHAMFYAGYPTRCGFQKPRCFLVTVGYEETAVRAEGDRTYGLPAVYPANFFAVNGIH